MFLFQEVKESKSYQFGYEVGKWVYHNPMLAILLGIVISLGFVWLLTKVVKQIRTFGE
ncbi:MULTISPECIES: hypothetical protein [Tenacibaculum]|uniref:hypothetical protein n=1 Tax=Tenacibaculum TaxID=104267 RepID=UPI0015880E2B|nr:MULTISPECIES: hypothetical protein [Tenacibaculum]MCF2874731.1 hypothetical protein [Tenacibaculum sp. Cn5-1]MCF2934203.1 hypothetical protein [Tenacibaculum sp. Cn5-34]MCG7510413.1 hypothetical protein [Tenacibaculum sp. Cn5-46]